MISDYEKSGRSSRTLCCFLFAGVLILAVGVVGGILIGIYGYHGGPNSQEDIVVKCFSDSSNTEAPKTTLAPLDSTTTRKPETTTSTINIPEPCFACKKRDPFVNFAGPELFAPLTENEMRLIRKHLINGGLISDKLGDNITVTDNYISFAEILIPAKQDVLEYLDDNAEFPGRFAEVVVIRGGIPQADVMKYKVGPLDKEERIQITKLISDGEIAFNARTIDDVEIRKFYEVLKPTQDTLKPLIHESFDDADFDNGYMFWWPFNGPPGFTESKRNPNLNAFLNPAMAYGDYHHLDMLPLSVVINATSHNPNDWYVHSIHYLNQGPFDTAQDLLDAYNSGSIRKIKFPKDYKDTVTERYYVGRDDTLSTRPNANMPPPRTYEPEGPRYTIKGHHVSWMGWSFDITTRMMRGPAIYDVRFDSQRIAYEVALNDIALIYASDSFERSNVMYTDASYGIGFYKGIIKGVDCPEHSTFLETSFYDAYKGVMVTAKSICIFEQDGEHALWRHTTNLYRAGLRNTCLVVRVAGSITNYDYTIEYHFKLDGKLYTKAFASGFIQTAFWYEDNPNHQTNEKGRDAFGFRVSDYSHGIIHDHMFGFKVDLDILGTENNLEVIHFKSGDALDALRTTNPNITRKPDYFRLDVTRYLEYEAIEREKGYVADPLKPKLYTIVNKNFRNKWGAKRGYEIVPLGTAVQTIVDSHPVLNTLSWTKYNCAVTKRKESEPFLDSIFDGYRLDNTKAGFMGILNNETIINEDLVAWVTVGFKHVPTSEDVPMTTAVDSGFVLKPFNYFDKTEVYDMPQVFESKYDNQSPPDFTPCLENN